MLKYSSLVVLAVLVMFSIFACGSTEVEHSDGDVDGDNNADGDETIVMPDGDKEESENSDGDLTDGDQELAETELDDSDGDTETIDGDDEAVDGDNIIPDELGISKVSSPDVNTLKIEFEGEADASLVSNIDIFSIVSAFGAVQIVSMDYDNGDDVLELTTEKMKLGVSYSLEIAKENKDDGSAVFDFFAADNHVFWVTDFSDQNYSTVTLNSYRLAVGEHCVVYVEDGYQLPNSAALVTTFDERIYPTLTSKLIAAPDMDENGKIVLIFLDGGEYYGGYFSPINQYTDYETSSWWGLHSNEMEIIHLNVITYPEYLETIAAHEFQHLLYHYRHGLQEDYWEYHDEGMAESAVHMVFGSYETAINAHYYDQDNLIRNGLSLVNWTYGLYENYTLAYLFWTYLAAQSTGDANGYVDFFDLEVGNPESVNTLIQSKLGMNFADAYRNSRLALWLMDDSGPYSFEGMLDVPAKLLPTVTQGTTSLDLEPFGGAFFKLNQLVMNYPVTVGDNIRYAGISSAGEVDLEQPFDMGSGMLFVYNENMNYAGYPKEHSGPDQPAQKSAQEFKSKSNVCMQKKFGGWADPPPFNPNNRKMMDSWRAQTLKRLGK